MKLLKKYRYLSLLIVLIGAVIVFTKVDFGYVDDVTTLGTGQKVDSTPAKQEEQKKPDGYQVVSLVLEDLENTDGQIEDYLKELFPIITDYEISAILGSKEITKKLVNDTLGIVEFKLNFKVPEHYLDPNPKILWELNIPEFSSRIYQIYNNDTILIDTWPNVVGKPSTKTYTGYYSAFRLRNWPSWKDPESDPLEPSTPPGPGNPLGLFVVHYDENSLRYFHGTNKNYLLKNEYRALSHGCVRNDNNNITKMKKFICEKVITSKDIAWWVDSKKSMIFEIAEEDQFPVRIIYKTFDITSDDYGEYIIFFKDIYNYERGRGWSKYDEEELMTFSTADNILAEYKAAHKPNQFSIPDDRLIPIIDNLIAKHKDYEKYYFEDLLSESGK
ncbi:MAG TPA: L,D-transpeptidase [Ignavibacteria bacterium]|nr:L,D-transpeptidase [Ignavibacteria bacterium]